MVVVVAAGREPRVGDPQGAAIGRGEPGMREQLRDLVGVDGEAGDAFTSR